METPNKEQVYDQQIEPLLERVISICEDSGIAVIMQFALPVPEDEGLVASTLIPNGDGKFRASHVVAAHVLGMPIE